MLPDVRIAVTLVTLACALSVGVASAFAQSKQSCTIIINERGTMRPNPGASVLSSSTPGAKPGEAVVIATNSSYSVSVDAPLGFSIQPSGGSNNTRFEASMSAHGATNFFSVPSGVEQRIKRGQTDVTVNIKATRQGGSFPAGQYAATVVLRCE